MHTHVPCKLVLQTGTSENGMRLFVNYLCCRMSLITVLVFFAFRSFVGRLLVADAANSSQVTPFDWPAPFDSMCPQRLVPFAPTRFSLGAAAVGGVLVLVGGSLPDQTPTAYVNYCDATGCATQSELSPDSARSGMAVAVTGYWALFAGGRTRDNASAVVNVVRGASQKWQTLSLAGPRSDGAGTGFADPYTFCLGSYDGIALFAGGKSGLGPSADVAMFFHHRDSGQWTRADATLSLAREYLSATTLGRLAIFAGGGTRVDIWHCGTHSWSQANLSVSRYHIAATTANGRAYFGGGLGDGGTASAVVDIFDGTKWTTAQLSRARYEIVAASTGTLAVFAGSFGGLSTIDVFESPNRQWTLNFKERRFPVSAQLNGLVFFVGADLFPESADVQVFSSACLTTPEICDRLCTVVTSTSALQTELANVQHQSANVQQQLYIG